MENKMDVFITLNIIVCIVAIFSFFLLFYRPQFNVFRKSLYQKLLKYIQNKASQLENNLYRKLFLNKTSTISYKYWMTINNINIDLFNNSISLYLLNLIINGITLSISIILCIILNNFILLPFIYIIIFICILMFLYSYTINERYERMIACINTENLLGISISSKFYRDISNNLNNIPLCIRKSYENYIRNTTQFNFSEQEALDRLNVELGGYSRDFLSNVKIYLLNPVDGFKETFKNNIEINNKRLQIRYNFFEKSIENSKTDFSLAFIMSFGLYSICFIFLKVFRLWYLNTFWGKLLLIINIFLLIFIRYIFTYFKGMKL